MNTDYESYFELEGYDEALAMFGAERVDKAKIRAANRAGSRGKTLASKLLRAEWNMKKRDIDSHMSFRPARPGKPEAYLRIASAPFPLEMFAAKDQRPKGVSYKIKKKGGRKRLSHDFETFARSGHRLILHRSGKKRPSLRRGGALAGMVRPRYPVAERKVITLASMFDRSAVYDPVEDLIGEVFEHEFARQLTVLS